MDAIGLEGKKPMYILICAAVFAAAYLLNTTLITVFDHRGLAHRAVVLRPGA